MLKPILIIIAFVLTGLGIYIAWDILGTIAAYLIGHPTIAIAVAVAVLVQLMGHVLRAKRTKLVLDQAASSSLQFQFGALSTGYLFNALLPLRLGELIRALLVARRLRISLLYTFVAVVIERATDVIFLGILIAIGAVFVDSRVSGALVTIAAIGVAIAAAMLLGLILLKDENKYILRTISSISGLFNASIRNTFRFKIWSLIFGLQSFFSNGNLVRQYVTYAVLSWLCYFVSAMIIIITLFSFTHFGQLAVASVSPYIISTNPVDAVASSQLTTLLPLQVGGENLIIYGQIIWAVLTLPMAFLGLFALILYRTGKKKAVISNPYHNKLQRHEDISQEFPAFLESYFLGQGLARVLHKLETEGDLRLVKYFKGGSDAITVLVMSDDKLYVKKIIPIEYEDRLKAQFTWLKDHSKLRYLVNVIGEQKTDEYYAIDLEYDPDNVPFFEYVHHSSLAESKVVLEKIWKSVYAHLYQKSAKPVYDPEARDAFIKKHIDSCVEKAAAVDSDLQTVLQQPTIVINGKEYDNLNQIMARIKKNKQAWQDIATYSHAPAVHGDTSIDNFLVSSVTGKPLIIDPAPDGNIINGPVFDLGKLGQSFYCGYEFLFRDENPVALEGKNIIRYREQASAKYAKLWRYVQDDLASEYLSEAERRAMIFHAGVLHIRRLKHQVHYNPVNTLKFYAVGVKTLNEFLDQYEKSSSRG